jgi:hypothetical protein
MDTGDLYRAMDTGRRNDFELERCAADLTGA